MTTPFLSMGQETYKVSMKEVFGANRRKLCQALRNAGYKDGSVVLQGGRSETRYDSDHEPIFRQESYFWYLSGVKEPDCILRLCIETEEATLYIPNLPAEYATIMGPIATPEQWRDSYSFDRVMYIENFQFECETVVNRVSNGTRPKLFLMKGRNSDSGIMYDPPEELLSNVTMKDQIDVDALFPILAECRVIKTEAELKLLQFVTEVTSFAHAYVMRNFKPGNYEYQGESLFRHYCYYNYGCRLVGYTPICGCGPNSAILHYGHAGEPNMRKSDASDMALFDMGAEYFGYGSDVTCSFPVNGSFSELQGPIYETVLTAQIAVYDMIKPGVSWVDCHKAAEVAILAGLEKLGIVERNGKSLEELVELRLGAVFMPHGLGHFIGIDTHDVGGYAEGHPNRINLPGLKSLRTARTLKQNMVLTVEPGCYFIDHLLDQALSVESPLREHLDAEKVEAYRGFGGVRLEDVITVTSSGIINFTLCPRAIDEVEHVVNGGNWPPLFDTKPELRRSRLTDPNPVPPPPST